MPSISKQIQVAVRLLTAFYPEQVVGLNKFLESISDLLTKFWEIEFFDDPYRVALGGDR